VLRLEGVSFRYPGAGHDSLHAVSLDLAPGRVTGLAGPAGAGKSTLCLVASGLAPRVIGGTLVGAVGIDGVNVARWPMHQMTEHVVMGLQDPAGQLSLIAETVMDEVTFGPANLGLARDEVVGRATAALDTVGVSDLAARDPRGLSGGQLQLVVIAGLLAMRPSHLILDEPTAHLDARSTARVLAAIERIAATGTAVLLAEHRIESLVAVCDQLAVIAAGNIVVEGAIDTVLAEPAVSALGVSTTAVRLRREVEQAGLDPALLEPTP
jgi:energy-coupling factor transporter ATP-binding protein EcfA2